MEVSAIHVEKNRKLGGYEAKASGHHVTNGESGHFIEVIASGGTQERAWQELCS
jgi:hypothetical protein